MKMNHFVKKDLKRECVDPYRKFTHIQQRLTMVNKYLTIPVILLMFMTNLNASEKVSLEDMAKALEILIVDMKSQKEKVASIGSNKTDELQSELSALKSKIVLLEEANSKQLKINTDISKKLDEALSKPKEDRRTFLIESVPTHENKTNTVAEDEFYKTTAHLKVHSEASIASPTITYLPKGAIVKVIEERNGVALTEIGWVSKYYLSKMAKE